MSQSHALVPMPGDLSAISSLVVNAVRSAHSKRAYTRAVADFLQWWNTHGRPRLNKATVQHYQSELETQGLAPASINLRLSAIRKLAAEAADNNLLAPEQAASVGRVKGARMAGVRQGLWLTRDQAEKLLSLPDAATNKGKRDRLALALLIGCGLRRTELASLRFEHIQQREGRWVIADLVGKGGRIRTVPMPCWAKPLLDAWAETVRAGTGPVFRPVSKSDVVFDRAMTAQSIFNVVKQYGVDLGVNVAPHDLRRTFAKLAHRGRAPLEQIQLSLGHSSVLTTERYLGVRQDLADAPCDHLGLSVEQP